MVETGTLNLRKINLIFEAVERCGGGKEMGYDAFEIVGGRIVYYSRGGQSISYELEEDSSSSGK